MLLGKSDLVGSARSSTSTRWFPSGIPASSVVVFSFGYILSSENLGLYIINRILHSALRLYWVSWSESQCLLSGPYFPVGPGLYLVLLWYYSIYTIHTFIHSFYHLSAMLSFRSRASRSGGGSSESHMSLPVPATSSLFDRKPFHASGNKTSLRGRLKDITKNITRRSRSRSIPEHNRNSMPGTPSPWYDVKSHDDLLCLAPADAQHVELAGQTWPAIRRNIGSMAPYLWTSRDSTDSSRSPGEVSHQSSGRNLKPGFGVFQEGGRRWATMVSRVHPMTCRRSTSRARRSSFSTISEAMSRQDYGPAPQLPMLTDSSDFLESLSKTGLFRRFTPLSEVNSTAGSRPPSFVPCPCIT